MSSLEKVLSILLDHRKDWFLSRINSIGAAKRPPSTLTLECIAFDGPIQLLHKIFDTLLLVFDNKYWVVQKRYCRFIATIDYGALSEIIGCDSTEAYRVSEKKKHFFLKIVSSTENNQLYFLLNRINLCRISIRC